MDLNKKTAEEILKCVLEHTDICFLCEKKGVVLNKCNVMTDQGCINKIIRLYQEEEEK